jgi:arginine decarboxylase
MWISPATAAGSTVLLVLDETDGGRPFEGLIAELEAQQLKVHRVTGAEQAGAIVQSDAGLGAALVTWDTSDAELTGPLGTGQVLRTIAARFHELPVFLLVEGEAHNLPLWAYDVIQGCIWPLEDTPAFIAGRIRKAVADTGSTCCRRSSALCGTSTQATSSLSIPPGMPAASHS